MGDFPGHALAGSFFFIMGLWWSTKSILMHVCKKQKRACFLGSKALFHRSEILEGMVIVGMVLTGIVCLQSAATSKEGQWVRILRWHHLTIYLFYGLCGVVNILCFTITSLPVSLTKLMLSNAFFADAFTLYNHTHGREMVDIFVHQLLTFATILAGLVAFIEFLTRSKVTLVLLRSSLIMLQGSWLWQAGFVLYAPTGGPAWDLEDHSNIMLLSLCFCWHYAFICIIIGVIYAVVTWLVKWRLKRLSPSEVELLKNDEREQESEEEV
ncbi:transmembrane protein 45A-like isoform X2 [Castor canadensis]